MIGTTTNERLRRLRALLTHAIGATSDTTTTGRHVAVVALDGACEQALHLIADELGIAVKRSDSVLDLHSKVAAELGTAWNKFGAKGVRELHVSRNGAQHHGVLPDQGHVPLWAAEVDAYVHSLIRAAIGVELADVRAADAIADDRLREQLSAAELAISDGRYGDAVRQGFEALDRARESFKQFRRIGSLDLQGLTRYGEFRSIQTAITALHDFTDIAYLASDPSDWLWLKAVHERHRSSAKDDVEPTVGEAQRAVAFAVAWVLRMEAFIARYPKRLNREPKTAALDVDYPTPQIRGVSANIEIMGSREEVKFAVDLADVPPEWHLCVMDAQAELREAGRASDLVVTQMAGENQLWVTVTQPCSSERVRELIGDVISATHQSFLDRLASRRGHRDAMRAAANAYRTALGPDPHGLIASVASEAELWGRESEPRIAVKLRLPDDIDPRGLNDAIGNAYVNADAELRIRASDIPAVALAAHVGEAIQKTRKEASERQSLAEDRQRRLAELVDSVRSQMALTAVDGTAAAAD